MFFVRFLVLVLLIAFGLALSHTPIGLTVFLWVPLLYLLPTYEAWKNGHPSRMAIAILNVLTGWTGLGWVAAAVWAFTRPGVAVRADASTAPPAP